MSNVAIKSGTQIPEMTEPNLQMGAFIINPADDKTYFITWEEIARLLNIDLASSAIQGVAITTTVPIAVGFARYVVNTAGTFTNFKDASNASIVVTSGDVTNAYVELWGKNNVWQKIRMAVDLSNYLPASQAVAISDIVDNLNSTSDVKPLSAKQGKILSDMFPLKIDASQLVHNFDSPNANTFADTLATNNRINAALATALNSSYKGNASPTTNPGAVSSPQYWTATEAGTYANFGGVQVTGDFAIIYWEGVWKVSNTDLKADTFIGTVQAVRNLNAGAYSSVVTNDFGGGMWRLDASDTTSLDNTGTVIVTTNGKRYKRVFDGPLQFEWFGKNDFNGTAGTDNLATINAVLSGFADINLVVGPGKWYFSGQFAFPNNKNVFFENYGELYFPVGESGPFLESSNTAYRFVYRNKGIIRSLNSGTVSGYTGIGTSIKNCYNREIELGVIWNFGDGVKIYGEGTNGSQYNKVSFDRMVNCKRGLVIWAADAGSWCNQNQFFCGELRCYDGLVFDHSGLNTDPFNGNIFYGLGIEQCTNSGLTLDYCQYNTFFAGRTAAAENPATYLFNFSSTAKYNNFLGFTLYEADVQSGIRTNSFIGPIFTASGTLSSAMNLTGLNITAAWSQTAFNETVNDYLNLVRTDRENSQFANIKTTVNGITKTMQVDYTKKYQFVNTTSATLNDPIGFVRVNSASACTLTLSADELNTAFANNYTMFFVDVRTAVTVQILSGVDSSVLIASSLIPGAGFYQVIYSQADWKVWRLDRDTSGGVAALINRNTVTANMQIGTASGSSWSLFLGANGQDQLRFHPDSLRMSLYGFLSNPNAINNGIFNMPDTGPIITTGSATGVGFEVYLGAQASTAHIINFRNYETLVSWINRQGFFKSPVSTGTLDFPSVPANSESAALTVTVTGAAANDFVLITPNANTPGIVYKGFVTATDTVSVYACNFTTAAIDPGSGTFRVTVIKAS